jgi:hypothetical protein
VRAWFTRHAEDRNTKLEGVPPRKVTGQVECDAGTLRTPRRQAPASTADLPTTTKREGRQARRKALAGACESAVGSLSPKTSSTRLTTEFGARNMISHAAPWPQS